MLRFYKNLYQASIKPVMLSRLVSTIAVSPNPSLADQHVDVNISRLQPKENFTLYAEAKCDSSNRFFSIGHYKSDNEGTIDLSKHESLGGFYTGNEPMGFMWSMKCHPDNTEKQARYMQKDVAAPILVNLKLFDKILDGVEGISPEDKTIAETSFNRFIKSPNVKEEILDGDVKATLFIPEGEGPFPVLITLYGAVAKYVETKGASLASHGIMCLALSFFGSKPGLPKTFWDLDLEYFEKTVEFMNQHPKTSKKHGIAVTGISLGGVITQAMAARLPGISKSIIVNCPIYTDQLGLRYKGEMLWPQVPKEFTADMLDHWLKVDTWSYFSQIENPFDEAMMKYLPPFHKNKKMNYLFQYSEDDRNCNTMMYAKHVKTLLDSENHPNYSIKTYPKAGHVIDPPYFPLYPFGYAGFVKTFLPYGGTAYEHHLAQLAAWDDLISFIKDE